MIWIPSPKPGENGFANFYEDFYITHHSVHSTAVIDTKRNIFTTTINVWLAVKSKFKCLSSRRIYQKIKYSRSSMICIVVYLFFDLKFWFSILSRYYSPYSSLTCEWFELTSGILEIKIVDFRRLSISNRQSIPSIYSHHQHCFNFFIFGLCRSRFLKLPISEILIFQFFKVFTDRFLNSEQ